MDACLGRVNDEEAGYLVGLLLLRGYVGKSGSRAWLTTMFVSVRGM